LYYNKFIYLYMRFLVLFLVRSHQYMVMSDVNLIFQSNTLKRKQFIILHCGDLKGNIQNQIIV